MADDPKVNIVMTVYNEEKYLIDAVDSILDQTFKDFEFIIINDGSTDRSKSILESYNDPRIRLVHQENKGLIKSLNIALKMARSEYIARMDADDISMPERLKKEVDFLDKHRNVGLVGTFSIKMDENGRDIHYYKTKSESEDLKKALWEENPFAHGSLMFRKECLEKVGFYREKLKYVEDYDLWFRISEFYDVANIAQSLFKFRVNPRSISYSNKFEQNRRFTFVKMLAEERRRYGRDRLEEMSEEDIDKILDEIVPQTERNEKKASAMSYTYLAEVSYCARDYARSVKWLLRALTLSLFNRRGWILAFKLIACLIFPSKIIDKFRR